MLSDTCWSSGEVAGPRWLLVCIQRLLRQGHSSDTCWSSGVVAEPRWLLVSWRPWFSWKIWLHSHHQPWDLKPVFHSKISFQIISNVSAPLALVSWALTRAGAVHKLIFSQIVLGSVVNRLKQLHRWLRVILVMRHVSSPRSFPVFLRGLPSSHPHCHYLGGPAHHVK